MANLAPTQVEQLQRIGSHLRQVRQEQGLPLDILANQIFIRPAILQALETAREDQLPEPVFIQGFIRRYAEALGLDGKAIAQDFPVSPPPLITDAEFASPSYTRRMPEPQAQAQAPTPAPAPPTPEPTPVAVPVVTPAATQVVPAASASVMPPLTETPPAVEPAPVAPTPTPARPTAAPPIALRTQEHSGSGWLMKLALGVGILILGGAGWAWFGRGLRLPTLSLPTADTSPQTEAASTEEATPPEGTAPNANAPTEAEPTSPKPEEDREATPEAPIVVTANLSDKSWLSVRADGKTIYEGTPDKGYEETWTAETSLIFITGNAGSVSLAVNGDDPVVLGDSGAVRTVRITPDSNAAELGTP